ncbi:glutathione ABC transporter substrate-binding protein [Brevibacillus reuszeri]|uniref:ABC transporter substrate-binding protein n=1 Tax=Brevibacillus reuszeri TaxID=54915 RepID=A0A0K9YZI4_9BACL|nr:glutathione ABC transporter substrate-binding protein [Brevibacillus reuszeri]KNB73630.1 ABC transporter substrate-binding protein [Brevibacillus reuszeri]MED1858564.1 glutathione ABC transporter substrate-binding protein [Brevibacillus reuszeri]GED69539.1 glutathione ABC transporter substrate-binding protein [Brevibacillus reuszeri]
MKRKRLLGSVLALSLMLVSALTGCASGQQTSGTGTAPSTAAPAGNQAAPAPASPDGGTLIIARLSDANNLDPHFSTQINSMAVTQHKLYEGLVMMDKSSEYKPLLATEWKQLDDVTWEFTLREGVTFHDGAPFNAEAVKKTIDRILDKDQPTPKANMFGMIKEVKIIDPQKVQIILHYPFAGLLSVLASAEGGIISPKAIEQYGKDLAKHPVGTGPFTFESWTPGQEIVIVKNENYWGTKPKVDKVVFKTIPEDATRVAMVEAGEAHVAEQLPVTELERVQNSTSMSLGRFESFAVDHIGMNVTLKPFDDVRVRQAIAHAVDKESIIKGVYNNVGKAAISSLGPKVIGYSPNIKTPEYDLNKAKQLLTEAGYGNGFKATIYLNDNKARINVAEVLQSQLKGIGIDLQIQVMEFGAYLDLAAKGEAQMFISGWGNATGDGDYNQYNLFHSTSKGVPGNHSFYSNPKVDALIEAARKEKDPEKRKEIYAEAQQIEMDEVPLLPYRSSENLAAIAKNVEGVYISPSGYIEVNDITIK